MYLVHPRKHLDNWNIVVIVKLGTNGNELKLNSFGDAIATACIPLETLFYIIKLANRINYTGDGVHYIMGTRNSIP